MKLTIQLRLREQIKYQLSQQHSICTFKVCSDEELVSPLERAV
jgi:hypothetical protein